MPVPGNTSQAPMLSPEEQRAADHMKYAAMAQRRSQPPRCHPITIVILVMSAGFLFIGLTMTIIAHWPGSTSIGENPLKIAGPVLLCTGVAGFILGIVLVGTLNKKEKKRFVKSVNSMAASRVAMSQSQQSLSAMNNSGAGPGMKPNPYRATASQAHDDSSASNYTGAENSLRPGPVIVAGSVRQASSGSTAPGYSHDSYGGSKGTDGHAHSSSTADQEDLPQPVRVRKPRKSGGGSRENLAGNPNENQGLLSSVKTPQGVDVPPSYEALAVEAFAKSHAYRDESDSAKEEKKKKRPPATAPKPPVAKNEQEGGEEEAYRLRVHVRAAPGSSVSIRQGSKENIHNKSTASIETDF